MRRRDFLQESSSRLLGLAGLTKLSFPLGEDPIYEIKKEIANLMKQKETTMEVTYDWKDGLVTHYISPERIYDVDLSLDKLKKVRHLLEILPDKKGGYHLSYTDRKSLGKGIKIDYNFE